MFNPFEVVDKVQESRNICSFYLKPTDQKRLLPYLPGQHIIVRLDIPGQQNPVQRSYTLSAAPGQDYYRINSSPDTICKILDLGRGQRKPAGFVGKTRYISAEQLS